MSPRTSASFSTSVQVEAQPAHRAITRERGWRLGGRLRKTVLLFHIAAGGIWLGLDVAMANAANLGGQLALGADLEWDFTNLLYPPIVSPSALSIAFLLAVFKPWGRIRRPTRGLT